MSLAMTKAERESFLAGLHVGILCVEEPGHGPLAVPIWYDYEPDGELWVITGKGSHKGKLLSVGCRLSLCAQTEEPPYKYVSVEGPVVSIEATDKEKHLRPMARRYLGAEGGDRYVAAMSGAGDGSSVVVRMRPERWLTVDYAKRPPI